MGLQAHRTAARRGGARPFGPRGNAREHDRGAGMRYHMLCTDVFPATRPGRRRDACVASGKRPLASRGHRFAGALAWPAFQLPAPSSTHPNLRHPCLLSPAGNPPGAYGGWRPEGLGHGGDDAPLRPAIHSRRRAALGPAGTRAEAAAWQWGPARAVGGAGLPMQPLPRPRPCPPLPPPPLAPSAAWSDRGGHALPSRRLPPHDHPPRPEAGQRAPYRRPRPQRTGARAGAGTRAGPGRAELRRGPGWRGSLPRRSRG
jgi:hypothetical protein